MTWEIEPLKQLLTEQEDIAVTSENNCLCITNPDGIEAFLAISGEQIIVEAILFGKEQVKDPAALNEEILKTHQFFPLTTAAITEIEGSEYYIAFGSLSSQSKAESILIEIETLFQNVEGFLDAYQSHLKA